MKATHAFLIAAVLAVAAVLGFAAVTRTSTLGATAKHTSTAALTARAHKLDAFEASLQKALKSKPPALPKAPAAATIGTAPRVIYHRPAPIVIHKSAHHGGDGYEHEGGGERDD